MGERVEVELSGKGAAARRVLNAMRAAGMDVSLFGGGRFEGGVEQEVSLMVALPDEAAKHDADWGGRAEELLEVSIGRAHKWRERAEKAEAALVAQAKHPSAGDRVRGLVRSSTRVANFALDGNWPEQAVTDLAPLIAAELDKQDAASSRDATVDDYAVAMRARERLTAERFPSPLPLVSKTGDVASAKAGGVEFADLAKSMADVAKAAQPDAPSRLWAAAFAQAMGLMRFCPEDARKFADRTIEHTKDHEAERDKIALLIEAQLLDGWAVAK